MINNITKTLYTSVSRGLFEAHKVTFSFLMSTSINRQDGSVDEALWRLLLVKSVVIPSDVTKKQRNNPDKDQKYLTLLNWEFIFYLDTILEKYFEGNYG